MIHPGEFLQVLKKEGVSFFAGVPDSLMKSFLLELQDEKYHYITANEGAAIAMAAGYHLATGKTGLVYLQNSGLGNAINPLTSLVNREVYSIPLLLMIGWRGQPGKKDEPQHQRMGTITQNLLQILNIPIYIISASEKQWAAQLKHATEKASEIKSPVALLVEEGSFEEKKEQETVSKYSLSAEDVLQHVYKLLSPEHTVVLTTGKLGRLFYNLNSETGKIAAFMNVGAMGHAVSIATALSVFSSRKIVLIDGDGSLLMHMGSLGLAGTLENLRLIYILMNNGAHQSVGGQPTIGFHIDFCKIAQGCGFNSVNRIVDTQELAALKSIESMSSFTEFRINSSMPENLPRPSESFEEAKEKLMLNL